MLIVSLLCLNWITGMTLADKSMFCCASNEEEIMDLFSFRLFPCHLWTVLSSCIKGHTYVRICKRLHLLWMKWPFVIKKKKNIKSWNVDSSQSRSHTHKKSVVKKGIYLDIKIFYQDHQKEAMHRMYHLYLCLMWHPKTKNSVMSNDNEKPFCTAECMH